MKSRREKPVWLKLLGASSSFALIGATTYIIVAGFNLIATLVFISSFSRVAVPAVVAAEGFLEGVIGFFEVLLEGVLALFELIADLFSSIFG